MTAKVATNDEYANVWNDSAIMNMAISHLLSEGAKDILSDKAKSHVCYQLDARMNITCIRYFEQYVAVHLNETRATYNLAKILESNSVDEHTLVKFFRHRIPCSCLDEKYEEVKHITKRGLCNNEECEYGVFSSRRVDRGKTKYCSRCRCVAYCCRECQEADWSEHKPDCDAFAAMKTEFEARQQNH